MNKLVGFKHKQFNGEVNGKQITSNKVQLFLLSDADNEVVGLGTSCLDVPFDKFSTLCDVPFAQLQDCINSQVHLDYGVINGKFILTKITIKKG